MTVEIVPRNNPCPCGSGKKYKKCHGFKPVSVAPAASPSALASLMGSPEVLVDGAFWRSLLVAVETQPLGVQSLAAASGIEHRILDVGVDQVRSRIVVLTDSADPKVSAFIQSDLQQIYPDQKVIAARAALVDVRPGLSQIAKSGAFSSYTLAQLKEVSTALSEKTDDRKLLQILELLVGDMRLRTNNPSAFAKQLLGQLTALNWAIKDFEEGNSLGSLIGSLTSNITEEVDGQLGICVIPVSRMSADEVENVKSSGSLGAARDLLSRYDVLEYFFPRTPDLALGLIDRGIKTVDALERSISLAPQHGHPLADGENSPSIGSVIAELQSHGFVAEGEFGFQTTVAGVEARALVKFKPKESLLVKIKHFASTAPLLKYFFKP